MIERGGHIVAVASIYAFVNGMLNASYAASKAGLDQLVRALRVELGPHGTTAGVAYLGFVETDLAREVFAQSQIEDARAALPGWMTRAIPAPQAAEAVVTGIERRAARVGAPGWVLPAALVKGVMPALDEVLIHHGGVSSAVRGAEQEHRQDR